MDTEHELAGFRLHFALPMAFKLGLECRHVSCQQERIIDLHRHARSGDLYELQLCLGIYQRQRWSVDVMNAHDLTPLQCADYGNPRIVRMLLQAGAEFRLSDGVGRQPIHLAVVSAQLESVRLLLEAGSDVNAEDDFEWRPLHFAVAHGSLPMVRLLLEHGADVRSDFSYLSLARHPAILDEFLAHGYPVVKNRDRGFEVMTEVIRLRSADSLRRVIEHGADVNIAYQGRTTPLALALEMNSPECAEVLLRHGADVHRRGFDSTNYLHTAAGFNCSVDLVKMLLERGVHVNCASDSGFTPLSCFVMADATESVRQMVEYGASAFGLVQPVGISNIVHLAVCLHYDRVLMYLAPSIYKSGRKAAYVVQFIGECAHLNNYYWFYVEELRRLELARFYGAVSLLDILVKDIYDLSKYARNAELVRAFDATALDAYPSYGGWLRSKFAAALERHRCLEPVSRFLNEVFRFGDPCHLANERIIHFLNNHEIRSIRDSLDEQERRRGPSN